MTFVIKQGDRQPALEMTLYADDDQPADLSAANEVRIVASRAGEVVIDRVVTGNAQGEVQLSWQEADTATPGDLSLEVRVTWSDGSQQTYPPEGYAKIRVASSLGSS